MNPAMLVNIRYFEGWKNEAAEYSNIKSKG